MKTRKLANTEVKETVAKTNDKGNKGRDEKYKDGGAGLSRTVKDRGAGPGKMVKGKGKSKGHNTKGNDGSRYYLLVDPRPGEAPRLQQQHISAVHRYRTFHSTQSQRDV